MSSDKVPELQSSRRASQEPRFRPLRLSVSNIAAMAGYHPYRNLPELVVSLVYQGLGELLNEDMEFLGLTLVSSDLVLESLARKAGVSLQQVREKPASTVREASAIKSSVIEKAEQGNQLTAQELNYLRNQVRQKVDTKYGTFHEEDALDFYEEQCGWPIRERNEEIRMWTFVLKESSEKTSVVPLGNASPVRRKRRRESSADEDSDDGEPNGGDPKRLKRSEISSDDSTPPPFFTILGSVDEIKEELTVQHNDDDSWVMQRVVVECKHRMNRIQQVPPLYEQIQAAVYCMMYEVDHADIIQVLRHENHPETVTSMNKAKADNCESGQNCQDKAKEQDVVIIEAPMEKEDTCSDGDESVQIVEVEVVTETNCVASKQDKKRQSATFRNEEGKIQAKKNQSIDEGAQGQREQSNKNERQRLPNKRSKPVISVSRVSLDDPIMNHRQNWTDIVLPRLQSFVEAVYTIRSDDALRRHFLLSASDPVSDMDDAWMILFDLCPWLRQCDTAFKQQMGCI